MWRVAAVAVLVVLGGCKQAAPDPASDLGPRAATVTVSASGGVGGSGKERPLRCADLQGCTDACGASAPPSCAEACVRRLTPAARPSYDALQACVVPHCANADAGAAPCRAPGSFACKMCVMARCPSQASACMTH
jgi:hypothetical protein